MKQLAVDDDTVVRTQSRPPAVWIWSGILAVVVVVAAVLFWVFNLAPSAPVAPASRDVPSLEGATYDSAADALRQLDLVPSEHSESSSFIATGDVIRTDPPAGTRVAPGDTVDVYVSTGATQLAVPSVTNMSVDAAQEVLRSAGFEVGQISKQHSASVRANTVMDADPKPGTPVTEGTTINLIVSDGLVELPNVVNLTVAEAREQLQGPELGLRVTIDRTGGCGEASDVVVAQSLAPGTVPQDSEITISYCDGS
jgi:beta-lactam-binding protein with PASTA domain